MNKLAVIHRLMWLVIGLKDQVWRSASSSIARLNEKRPVTLVHTHTHTPLLVRGPDRVFHMQSAVSHTHTHTHEADAGGPGVWLRSQL